MKQYGIISILFFVTSISSAQNTRDLELIRTAFQDIKNEEDVRSILVFEIIETNREQVNILEAYKGASQCMMANYVFSPVSKLKNFNQGEKIIEASITENMEVENVYLRLLIQLNIPKVLNYYNNIDGDIIFLDQHMSKAPIDVEYKKIMIKNLLSVAKTNEQEDALLQINLVESI